jgi:tetratricopeptide (TPR) repeat protein
MRIAAKTRFLLLVGAALLTIAIPARADKPAREHGRIEADTLERRAGKLAAQGLYVEAAEAYLALERDFERVYDPAGMCSVLERAAACLSLANLKGRAIEVRERLLEYYPDCDLAAQAVLSLGRDYEELAVFDKAAERYVEFATTNPYSPRAPGVTLQAIALFLGAGDHTAAQLVVPIYEKLLRRMSQHDAAAFVFDALEMLVETGDLEFIRNQYGRFLRRYERVAAPDTVVLAHVRVADTWLQDERPNLKRAQRHFRKALRIFEGVELAGVTDPARRARLLDAASRARYELALVAARRLDALSAPPFTLRRRLPPGVRKWWASAERPPGADDAEIQLRYWLEHVFEPWNEAKLLLLDEVGRRFDRVTELGVPRWSVRARARIADARMRFATALRAAEPPAPVAADPRLERVFRLAVGARVEPLVAGAIEAYAECHETAIALRVFGAESRHCAGRLTELRPNRPEQAEEMVPSAEIDAWHLSAPGPILEQPYEQPPRPLFLILTPREIDTLDPLNGLELP